MIGKICCPFLLRDDDVSGLLMLLHCHFTLLCFAFILFYFISQTDLQDVGTDSFLPKQHTFPVFFRRVG